MKRIVFCVQQLYELGGTEQVSINLANALAEKGHDVEVISMSETKTRAPVYTFSEKVKISSLGIPFSVLRFENHVPALLKKFRIITFLCYLFRFFHHSFWKLGIYRKRLYEKIKDDGTMICTSLDSYRYAPKKGKVINEFHFGFKEFKNFFFRMALLGARKPDRWVFLSEATLSEVCQHYPKLAPRSVFIYNPIRFPSELHLEEPKNRILFLGRYMPQKNPMLALETAAILKKDGFLFHLDFYGNGNLKETMEQYVEKEGLSDCVQIHPATKQVKEVILSSDLLLLTSEYEGWPLIIGEANALSRPVVSSEFGPTIHEMVKEGENGWIIPSKDPKDYAEAIKNAFSDPKAFIEMKKKAYEHSLLYSEEKILAKWEEIL